MDILMESTFLQYEKASKGWRAVPIFTDRPLASIGLLVRLKSPTLPRVLRQDSKRKKGWGCDGRTGKGRAELEQPYSLLALADRSNLISRGRQLRESTERQQYPHHTHPATKCIYVFGYSLNMLLISGRQVLTLTDPN